MPARSRIAHAKWRGGLCLWLGMFLEDGKEQRHQKFQPGKSKGTTGALRSSPVLQRRAVFGHNGEGTGGSGRSGGGGAGKGRWQEGEEVRKRSGRTPNGYLGTSKRLLPAFSCAWPCEPPRAPLQDGFVPLLPVPTGTRSQGLMVRRQVLRRLNHATPSREKEGTGKGGGTSSSSCCS